MKRGARSQTLAVVFLLGLLLFNYPLLYLFDGGHTLFGVPLLYEYIFSAWLGLIVLFAVIVGR